MVDYDRDGGARFAEAAMLTLLGVLMVSLGALASARVWLAAGGAMVAGCLMELPIAADRPIAVIRAALLLSFMLAMASPVPARSVLPYLAGWALAGVMAQPALLLIWVPLAGPVYSARSIGPSRDGALDPSGLVGRRAWIGRAIGAGLAPGLAVVLTRLLNVGHAFWVILGVLPVLAAKATLTTGTFWQEQAGTMIGFLVSMVLVAILGTDQASCWLSLPFIVFLSAYAYSAIGFVAGQAAFTTLAVFLFCIFVPEQRPAGIARVADVASAAPSVSQWDAYANIGAARLRG